DFNLLKQHNEQTPHLLGFTRWIKRGYWQYQDIFNKQNFLNKDVQYWVEDIAQQSPLFIHKRAVNWLFKQDYLVIDWVSENLKDPNIRLAVTALSFVDCSKVHPHVIQLSIQYFEQVIGHLFNILNRLSVVYLFLSVCVFHSNNHGLNYLLSIIHIH